MDMDMYFPQFDQELENKAIAIENDLPDDLLFLDLVPAAESIPKLDPIPAPQTSNLQDQNNEYHDPDVLQYIQQEEKFQQQQQLLHQFSQQQQSNVSLQNETYQNEIDANIVIKNEKQIPYQYTQQQMNLLAQHQNHNGHVDVNNFVKGDIGLGQGQQQQTKPQMILQRQQMTVRQPLVVQRRQQPVVQQQVMQNKIQGTTVSTTNHQRIQNKITMMLHASKCLNRERELKKNNEELNCKVSFCRSMRIMMTHLSECTIKTKDCPVPNCFILRTISKHWVECKSPTCQVCIPIKKEKLGLMTRTNSSTSAAPNNNMKQFVNVQRLSG